MPDNNRTKLRKDQKQIKQEAHSGQAANA